MALDDDRIQTPALDGFMAERPGRLFSAAESLASFRDAAAFPEADDPALQPHLVVAIWRFARAAAATLGRLAEDETLEDALSDSRVDPWRAWLRPRATPSQRALIRSGATSVLYELANKPVSPSQVGFPLLPPQDPAVAKVWCAAFGSVAEDLRLTRAPRGPDVLRLLEDPRAVVHVRVSEAQVSALEELAIDDAQRVLLRHGERGVVDLFRDRYGLSRRECLQLVRLARADVLRYGKTGVEDDRALMVAQLKEFVDRAREACNQADELRGLRELARVQGLTRTEPEDVGAEFLGVVRRIGEAQDASLRLPESAAPAADWIPPAEADALGAEDAAFEVIDAMPPRPEPPSEHAALDEFDEQESLIAVSHDEDDEVG